MPNNNFARVQGTLMVNSDGTITITPTTGAAVGPLTLNATTDIGLGGATLAVSGTTVTATATLSGAASVMYDSQTNAVNQIRINMPTTTPGSGTQSWYESQCDSRFSDSYGQSNMARVQGTLMVIPMALLP